MLNQKGFSSPVLFIVLALFGVGFYLGLNSQKSIVSDTKNVNNLTESISSSSNNLSSDQPSFSKDGYSSTSDQEKITISGRFTVPPFNKIWYNYTFPKKGGELVGSLSGFCNGKITGNVSSPDVDNESSFTGVLDAKCSPIIGFSFNTNMKADLEGQIDYKTGRILISYYFSQPYELRGGGLNMSFTP